MKNRIRDIVGETARLLDHIGQELPDDIQRATELIVECYREGGKVVVCGNGGSAADAQHMAGELMGRFAMDRAPLACIALTTNTSVLTAWTNDYEFETVFERQLAGIGKAGDVLIGISTSGNSENVLAAVRKAREMGLRTIGLLGRGGGSMKGLTDVELIVPSADTPRIQEGHITLVHVICGLVEEEMFGRGEP